MLGWGADRDLFCEGLPPNWGLLRYTGTYFVPMLNALRMLTRVVPVVFEDPVWTENLFWPRDGVATNT